MKFRVISYYAELDGSGYYRRHAERLIASLEQFRLPYEIPEIESRGSYQANCIYKPKYILEKWRESSEPVVWLDADTTMHRDLEAFHRMGDDVDVGVATPDGDLGRMKASPLLFNKTPVAGEFLDQWIRRIDENLKRQIMTFDHESLLEVVDWLQERGQVADAGEQYCEREYLANEQTVLSMGISRSRSKREGLRRMAHGSRRRR